MLQKPIVLSDETFHQTFFSSYKAYVQLGERYVNVSFLDTVRKKFVYFASQRSDEQLDNSLLKNILNQHHISPSLAHLSFFISSPHVQVLPKSFYDEENLDKLYKFSFGEESLNKTITIQNTDDTCLQFQIPSVLSESEKEFLQIKFYPHLHLLINQSDWMTRKFAYKSSAFIHIDQTFFEIVINKEEKPILINTYSYQHMDDILYFIHWMIKNIGLDTKATTFVLSGLIDKKSELVKKMKDFELKTEWAKFNPQYIYSYRFNELQIHQFATLFCVKNENY